MKVVVNNVESKKAEIKYPVLMKWNDEDLVVLFVSEFSGTVIVAGLGYKLGFTCDGFESAQCANYWKKFEGAITLENE